MVTVRYFILSTVLTTFRMSCRRHKMYIGDARLFVCLSLTAFPHYFTDQDVT